MVTHSSSSTLQDRGPLYFPDRGGSLVRLVFYIGPFQRVFLKYMPSAPERYDHPVHANRDARVPAWLGGTTPSAVGPHAPCSSQPLPLLSIDPWPPTQLSGGT
jgi:hypothetical protein